MRVTVYRMHSSWQKHDPLKLFFRRLTIVALLALLIFALSALSNVYGKEKESLELRLQAEREYAELASQETHLSDAIAKLQTARGKEEALREQYEVGRAGEHLVVIVEPKSAAPVHASTTWERWVGRYLPFWQ